MRAGQRVTLHGPDPAAVVEECRDVAEQYQSAFERKKSCVHSLLYEITPRILLTITIPLQMLLNSVTCRPKVAFDHLFDQLLFWFVYIHEPSLFSQQPSELLMLGRTRLKENKVGV